jgi:hypothetical protein
VRIRFRQGADWAAGRWLGRRVPHDREPGAETLVTVAVEIPTGEPRRSAALLREPSGTLARLAGARTWATA